MSVQQGYVWDLALVDQPVNFGCPPPQAPVTCNLQLSRAKYMVQFFFTLGTGMKPVTFDLSQPTCPGSAHRCQGSGVYSLNTLGPPRARSINTCVGVQRCVRSE